jgi:hypothetical protein
VYTRVNIYTAKFKRIRWRLEWQLTGYNRIKRQVTMGRREEGRIHQVGKM